MTETAGKPMPDRFMSRVPVQYGWVILAAAALGAFASTSGQTVGVAAFFDPIIQDLGLSRGSAASAYALGTLLGILPAPLIGRWIDRRGVRTAAVVIGLAVGMACVGMSMVSGAVELAFAFAVLRGAAVGGLALLSQHVMNLWFVRQRGMAAAAVIGGAALGGVLFPLLINALMPTLGWRAIYAGLGAATAFIITPILVLLFRGKPETFGLTTDLSQGGKASPAPPAEPRVTVAQAMRTSTFWLLTLAGFLSNMVGTSLLLHQVAILMESGLTRGAAVALLAPLAAIQAASILCAGFAIDRMGVRRLLPTLLVVLGAAPVLALSANSAAIGLAYAVALGAALGGLNTAQAAGYAEAFGRTNMGAIRGVATVVSVIGAAIGPLPPVLSLTLTGSYDAALWGFAAAAILAASLAAMMRLRSVSRAVS